MSNVIQASRIPWLAECKGKRVEYITGCTNGPDVCAVRARGLCWAESGIKRPCRQDVGSCEDCWSNGTDVCTSKFNPTVHPEALDAVRRLRKPTTLAWNLGGDAFCDGVDPEWRRAMWETVKVTTPQHTHVFLTKLPANIPMIEGEPKANNIWWGTSICLPTELDRTYSLPTCSYRNCWVSIEPLLGDVASGSFGLADTLAIQPQIKFIVIGGLSDGNGRIIPPDEGGTRPEWVQPIIDAAYEAGCRVFLKNLPVPIMRQITDPRTGKPFRSMFDWRELPDEWRHE